MTIKKHYNSRGTILVITIWILMLLSLLGLGFSYRMGIELKLVKYSVDNLQAFHIAKAGLYKGIAELHNDIRLYDCYQDNWGNNRENFKEHRLGTGFFTISHPYTGIDETESMLFGASDEQSKINLNKADPAIITKLLELLDEDKDIATNILDWIDPDSIPGNHGDGFGAEDGFYESLGKKYPCKNKPLEMIYELLLIKDINQNVFDHLKPYITIYGSGAININTAPALVLKALGMEESLADKIIEYRAGEDRTEGTQDDEVFDDPAHILQVMDENIGLDNREIASLNNLLNKKPSLIEIKSDYFTIKAKGSVNNIDKTIEAVVKRNPEAYPEIVYWKED